MCPNFLLKKKKGWCDQGAIQRLHVNPHPWQPARARMPLQQWAQDCQLDHDNHQIR